MLRIHKEADGKGRTVLRLEGSLLSPWVPELVGVLEYPDHYEYAFDDWQEIVRLLRNAEMVITTEKDLVKLERFPFARGKLVALRLGVTVDHPEVLLGRVLGPLALSSTPAPTGIRRS